MSRHSSTMPFAHPARQRQERRRPARGRPITLLNGLMQALTERNHNFNTAIHRRCGARLCYPPVGDQGADIAKTAALAAGWDWNAAGVQIINCFCASGLASEPWQHQKCGGWEHLVGGRRRRIDVGCRWRRTDGGPWRRSRTPIWMSILCCKALVPT